MLAECLTSIANLEIPTGIEPVLIVVENDSQPTAKSAIDTLKMDFSVIFIHEPRIGIACARNTALRAAQKKRVNWIAFIDDDEVADTKWLSALMAQEYLDTPILMGWQITRLPEGRPFWAIEAESYAPTEGQVCKVAYTNNVRMNIAIPNSGIFFDESLGLGGGEDTEYFTRAYKNGFSIKQTARAITYETLHATRLTYRRQIHRAYWIASANFRRDFIRRGKLNTFLKRGHTIPLNILSGIAILLASPLAVILGPNSFKRFALLGGHKLACGFGRIMAALGRVPQPYQVVDGS